MKFHNGERLTSQAVKDSLDAARKRAAPRSIRAPVDSITTPNDYTVVFNLSYSYPMTLVAASENGAGIVCEEALKAAASDSNYFESGEGVRHRPVHAQIVLVREAGRARPEQGLLGWLEEQPVQDADAFQITPEAIVQQQALQSGQVDVATRVPVENIAKVGQEPEVQGDAGQLRPNYLGFFNTTRPPLEQRLLVRRALAYAIPYKDIIPTVGAGLATAPRPAAPCRRASSRTARRRPSTRRTWPRRSALGTVRAQGWRLQPRSHLRSRKRGRGALCTADQGRLQEDRCHGERQVDALQPAVEGRPEG